MAMLNYQRVTVNVKIVGEASLDALNIMVEGRIRNLLYNPPLFRHWSTNDAAFTVPKWVWLGIKCLLPPPPRTSPEPKKSHAWLISTHFRLEKQFDSLQYLSYHELFISLSISLFLIVPRPWSFLHQVLLVKLANKP